MAARNWYLELTLSRQSSLNFKSRHELVTHGVLDDLVFDHWRSLENVHTQTPDSCEEASLGLEYTLKAINCEHHSSICPLLRRLILLQTCRAAQFQKEAEVSSAYV
jgi:hypothetical protein